jgi:hypothetical protein
MLNEFTKGRYKALELLADHIREPSRELRLDAIVCDVNDEDLRWVVERVHYFLLKLLEDAEYDPADPETDLSLEEIGLTD